MRDNLHERHLKAVYREPVTYPACVGLCYIGLWYRRECWNDKSNRKFPLHLRFVPRKWITWDRNGAKLNWPRRINIV